MGCECSRPSRDDVPTAGSVHKFIALPNNSGFIVYDENQSKWMELVVDVHLRAKAHMSASTWDSWAKRAQAKLLGPFGTSDPRTLMTLHIGAADFQEVDDPGGFCDEFPIDDPRWPAWWQQQEFIKINWSCARTLSVENCDGKNECTITQSVNGDARVCQVTSTSGVAPSPRDVALAPIAGMQHQQKTYEQDSKYEGATYDAQIPGLDRVIVDGQHHEPDVCERRYGGLYSLKTWSPNSQICGDATTIKMRFLDGKPCIEVETAAEMPPMSALCMGIAMGSFMHPLEVEKHATQWAFARIKDPRRHVSSLKSPRGTRQPTAQNGRRIGPRTEGNAHFA